MNVNEITAEIVEDAFDSASAARFTSLCNAIVAAKTLSAEVGYPSLSEKPGPDGSIDGEWTVPGGSGTAGGLGRPGWNVLQYKARGITSRGRKAVITELKRKMKGAAREATTRLRDGNKETSHYILFTNLQLGLESPMTNAKSAEYSTDRDEIVAAIREGSPPHLAVTVLDAANLASEINANAALRLTFFTGLVASSWQEKWDDEVSAKGLPLIEKLVGREQELKELVTWLSDDSVRVIALTGPHGMGKTRIALEATRLLQLRTTVVDNVDEFERWPLASLAVAALTRIIVVEDPGEEQAVRLAFRAANETGVKLILTIPSRDRAPKLGLSDATPVKELNLKPLNQDNAANLLKAANSNLDNALSDWIVQRAGGIPFVILSAAQIGEDLRGNTGSLKQGLSALFVKRVEKELGPQGAEILRIVSPLQSVAIMGEKADLTLLLKTFQQPMTTARAIELLERLEKLGVVRRRGRFATVTPPLFAAVLAEAVFNAYPAEMRTLYDQLDESGRRKFLERVVTLDLSDDAPFWDHVFAQCGGNAASMLANARLFYILARAAPERTAQCLSDRFDELANAPREQGSAHPFSDLSSAIRELVFNQATCGAGMRMLEALALAQPIGEAPSSALSHFREAFVHWYHWFPMAYPVRLAWVKRLLDSEDQSEVRLGQHVLVYATSLPDMLSGYSVTARRLGLPPPRPLWSELHDYLERLFEIRLDLISRTDTDTVAIMGKGLATAVGQLENQMPAERSVRILSRYLELFRSGRVSDEPAEIRRGIARFVAHYRKSRAQSAPEHIAKWDAVLATLEGFQKEFDEGSFILRLKIHIGRAYDAEEVEFEGKKMMKCEAACYALAKEAAGRPELVTPEVLAVVARGDSYMSYAFAGPLGECDVSLALLPAMEAAATRGEAGRMLALYLHGVRRRDPVTADARLEELAEKDALPKTVILQAMNFFGSTPSNRRRILKWVEGKAVDPAAVGQILGPRWLDNLPTSEVLTVLGYILTAKNNGAALVVHAISMYLHPNKALPRELIPFAESVLSSIGRMAGFSDYECAQVAIGISRTDKVEGFRLFRERMSAAGAAGWRHRDTVWNPLARHSAHAFWEFLRDTWPDDAYRTLPTIDGLEARDIFTAILNLVKHREVLLQIVSDPAVAPFFISFLSGSQDGFAVFAHGLLDLYPANAIVREKLRDAALVGDRDGSFSVDRYREIMGRVDKLTKDPATPRQHLEWWSSVRREAASRAAEDERRFGRHDEDLGWD